MPMYPWPSSKEAREQGCTCPMKENWVSLQRLYLVNYTDRFCIMGNCPIHKDVLDKSKRIIT